MLVLYSAAFIFSLSFGGIKQRVALMWLGFWYNDLRGADTSCIVRNFINGFGYICYTSGALEVISNVSNISLQPVSMHWFLMIGAVIFTTIHSQDMYDQSGDSLKGRCTVPLVIGDVKARWTIAIPVLLWSAVCPTFWGLGWDGYVFPMSLAVVIARRIIWQVEVEEDKRTFLIYNLWVTSLYLLPLIKCLGSK